MKSIKKSTFRKFDKIWVFFAGLFVVLLGADQLTKTWAEDALALYQTPDFGFALTHNYGMAFGLSLPTWSIYAIIVAVLAVGAWLVVKNKLWRDHWHLTGLALLLSGAIGNLIDRVRFGYVIDFIKIYWWPTFNLADVFIVAAVLLFAWEFLVREEGVSEI